MKSIVKSGGMRVIKDTDRELMEYWKTDSSKKEPEVWCIEGSYINTAIIRKLSCGENELDSAWSDNHDHTRGPEHHDHSSGIRIDIKSVDLNMINELGDNYNIKFMLCPGLKFREEKDGLIVALSLNCFFVNYTGSLFLKFFRDNNNFSLNDVIRTSKNIEISEDSGLNFFRKLLLFGLVVAQI